MARIEYALGDITTERVDAIVNAANSALLGGGGVDGAIHAAAGPSLLEECRALRAGALPKGLPVGEAVATGAGNLPARWVIHTVGPNWHRGQRDPDLLSACHRNSLRAAREVGARSIAFPAISAGVYGWDPERVATIAVDTVMATLEDEGDAIELVRFVLFSESTLSAYRSASRRARGAQ